MSAVTPQRGYPYQTITDAPEGHLLGENLALAIDTDMALRIADIAALAARAIFSASSQAARDALTGLYDGFVVYRTDLDVLNIYDGTGWRYYGRPTTNTVATSQTTGSNPYVDLATVGPAVTVETGTEAEVTLTCTMSNSGANHTFMGFVISGATTLAAADNRAVFANVGTNAIRMSATYQITGLTPGSNTFTAKYRTGAGTATFVDRNIHVTPN